MTATALRGNFVLLRADKTHLLVPQADVEAAGHIDGASATAARLVALSGQLQLLAAVPGDRYVITQFTASPVAFAWNAVQVLLAVDLPRQPLPPALQAPGVPINAFVEVDGALALCTSARQLLAFALPTEPCLDGPGLA